MQTPTRKRKYNRENLTEHASKCFSFAELIRSFGNTPTGGNYTHFQKLCRHYEVDTSHFTGMGWNKGHTSESHPSVAKTARSNTASLEEIFCEHSRVANSRLRTAMLSEGFFYSCYNEGCDNDGTWLGEPITLHVDHINGVHGDNRRENLRFLCPNCHQQTETWGRTKARLKK